MSQITVKWTALNLSGVTSVRDLWLHENRSDFSDSSFTAAVPAHGVVLLKIIGKENTMKETYEAEYAYLNNYNLIEHTVVRPYQAKVKKNMAYSGGAMVDSLGNSEGNWIAFNDVYVKNAGTYELGIVYICNGDRSMKININGAEQLLTTLNSHSSSGSKTRSINVRLKKGYNTVRFYNSNGMMPDLHKITIKAV